MYWIVITGLIIFIASLALNAYYVFRYLWKTGRYRRTAQYAWAVMLGICSLLLLAELFFAFYAQPDPYLHTLAAQNWFKRYWRLNAQGYRDTDWSPAQVEGRTKIMVLGDSIVAGHGLKNTSDRFADLLGQQLGDDSVVFNVGLHSAGTKKQLKAALEYPYSPDVIILSFHVDDVVDTATDLGVTRPTFVPASPRLVEESYLANYAYWHWWQPVPWPWSQDYQHWAMGLYTDPGVWETYRSLLLDIQQVAAAKNIRLMVVTFPNLHDVENSRPIINRVKNVFAESGVPVLDVTDLIDNQPADTLTVNAVDWHPNEVLHRQVAGALYDMLLEK